MTAAQTSSKIESDDMSLAKVFSEFYYVPDYQREYVWGDVAAKRKSDETDEVERFLEDIYTEFQQNDDSEYFIGTFVVTENPSLNSFELVDGQQRLTTSFVTLCALRDLLSVEDDKAPHELDNMVFTSRTVKRKDKYVEEKSAKLTLQYKDAAGILEHIVSDDTDSLVPRSGARSAQNIYKAYNTARSFLTENCEDRNALMAFYFYFTNKVKIIRVTTPTLQKALQIFETINDRGVGLDAMDLLKNLMFMKATPEEFSKLRDDWEVLTKTLFQCGEKPMRFLRYFLLADFASNNRIKEGEVYRWFQDHPEATGHEDDPMGFVLTLVEAAKNYAGFKRGEGPNGQANIYLQNLAILGGASMRQHLILLLAARRLPEEQFSRFSNFVERLMFVWYMNDTQTRDTEPKIVEICKALRVSEIAEQDYQAFEAELVKDHIEPFSKGFSQQMMNISADGMRKYRLKYLLAKITQFVEQEAKGVTDTNKTLYHFTSRDFEIEHILPQSLKDEAVEEFLENDSDDDAADYIQMLGNLLLIDKTRNIIASNDPYSAKVASYNETDTILSQYMARTPPVGTNDRISRTHATHLEVYETWTPKDMLRRQKMMTRMAHKIWDVPLSGEIPDWEHEE